MKPVTRASVRSVAKLIFRGDLYTFPLGFDVGGVLETDRGFEITVREATFAQLDEFRRELSKQSGLDISLRMFGSCDQAYSTSEMLMTMTIAVTW